MCVHDKKLPREANVREALKREETVSLNALVTVPACLRAGILWRAFLGTARSAALGSRPPSEGCCASDFLPPQGWGQSVAGHAAQGELHAPLFAALPGGK